MRAWIFLAGLALIGCSKKQAPAVADRPHSVREPATEFKDDLIAFSTAMGESRKQELSTAPAVDSSSVDSAIPVESVRPRRGRSHQKHHTPNVQPPSIAAVDSFSQNRPFTREEVEQFVRQRYRFAQEYLDRQDPRFHGVVEEAQALSDDGSFALLKARWALSAGETEAALVQAELALRAPFRLDPEGQKAAALLKCRALDSIKVIRPSERADAAAARAWLSYNLNYSP